MKVVVGIAAVEEVLPEFMAFSLSGGAIGIALDRMQAEGISQGFDFRYAWLKCASQVPAHQFLLISCSVTVPHLTSAMNNVRR